MGYGKLCTIIYDLDKPMAGEKELSLYKRFVNSKDDPILESMCGSGRFYIPLLKQGYNISGFDLSDEIMNSKLLYELIDNTIVIENEYQDFPLRIYSPEYLKNTLKRTGFRDIEELDTGNDRRFVV
ncbi:MAG: hypothetical protein JXB88_08190 [Spirochaetales bacterium]|nr:hypothetical protein [Spirochaetales bacterium]